MSVRLEQQGHPRKRSGRALKVNGFQDGVAAINDNLPGQVIRNDVTNGVLMVIRAR
jgi:hypothetical protein